MITTTRFELVDTEKLIPYVNNARTHSSEQIEKLRSSLREFGFVSPMIIDKDYNVLVGHGRLEAAKAEGIEQVPCVFAEHLTEAQKKAYILADNRYALDAGWDEELLSIELQGLQDLGFDVTLTGFNFDEIASLFEPEGDVQDDDFDADTAIDEEPPYSESGDVWILGEHRLMCGDSTKKEDIAVLMDGNKADLIVTDPPYNVAYEGSNGLTIQNDDMPEDMFYQFLIDAFSRMHEASKPGTPFYIWHAETPNGAFRRATNEALGRVRQMLIWNKNSFTLGRQDYQWKHEACIYGWTDGEGHYFVDDRTQASVIEDKHLDIDKMKKEEMRELLKAIFSDKISTTVIDENKPARNAEHPTMKPIKLLARLVKNSSQIGDIVLDTFGGSGSTLITCEQLNRSCYTMELDPKYADVIVKRWLTFTGNDKAELVRGGEKRVVTANML